MIRTCQGEVFASIVGLHRYAERGESFDRPFDSYRQVSAELDKVAPQ
jgi:hypothetical protein